MAKSELEEALAGQMRDAGLPEPAREFRFSPPRMWRADFCFLPERVMVEVEGGTRSKPVQFKGRWYQLVSGHNSGTGYQDNCYKYSEAAIQGWCVVRVTGEMIRNGHALQLIQRALRKGDQ